MKEEKDEEGDTVPCILDRLCTQHDGIPNEVTYFFFLFFFIENNEIDHLNQISNKI